MKRPTRVPASTVVRMNRASNMIAKWYQKARRPSPVAPAKIVDMPMASVGAPPVRDDERLLLDRAGGRVAARPGVIAKPSPLTNSRGRLDRRRRSTPAGEFIA